jgi:hypothetical protein
MRCRSFRERHKEGKLSEVSTESVPVPAGELAAFGLLMDRAVAGVREQVAQEIEAEAATHLGSVRRGMHWAAWVARGKPVTGDPGKDWQLDGALLHGDAERTAVPCCPVESAARADERERASVQVAELRQEIRGMNARRAEAAAATCAAERERIRTAAGDLKVTLWPGNGTGQQALDVVPLTDLLGLLGGQS